MFVLCDDVTSSPAHKMKPAAAAFSLNSHGLVWIGGFYPVKDNELLLLQQFIRRMPAALPGIVNATFSYSKVIVTIIQSIPRS